MDQLTGLTLGCGSNPSQLLPKQFVDPEEGPCSDSPHAQDPLQLLGKPVRPRSVRRLPHPPEWWWLSWAGAGAQQPGLAERRAE